jgi:hypothetical protein
VCGRKGNTENDTVFLLKKGTVHVGRETRARRQRSYYKRFPSQTKESDLYLKENGGQQIQKVSRSSIVGGTGSWDIGFLSAKHLSFYWLHAC